MTRRISTKKLVLLLALQTCMTLGCDQEQVPSDKVPELDETSASDKWQKPLAEHSLETKGFSQNPALDYLRPESTLSNPMSTFSVDVDTASYSLVRDSLLERHTLPPKHMVRTEELLNFFDYTYPKPEAGKVFGKRIEFATSPWDANKKLMQISLATKEIELADRPDAHLVFLIDSSGSMYGSKKLPLLISAFSTLVDHLKPQDKISIVTYAGSSQVLLDKASGSEGAHIVGVLQDIRAGGSTAGAQGIMTAYKIAQDGFIEGGINRVLIATDGDFNVGTSSTEELKKSSSRKGSTRSRA